MFSVLSPKSGIRDPRLFALLLLSLCLSGFDAAATVQHIAHGVAVEFNPLMRYFLEVGWVSFLLAKVLLTTVGLWVCYVMRHQKLGRWGLWLAAGVYQAVTLYHVYIFTTAY